MHSALSCLLRRNYVEDLEDWRGQVDQIMANFAATAQRQCGELNALKAKVLKVESLADQNAQRYSAAALGSVRGAVAELDARVAQLEAGSGDLWEVEEKLATLSAQCEEMAALQEEQSRGTQVRSHGGSTRFHEICRSSRFALSFLFKKGVKPAVPLHLPPSVPHAHFWVCVILRAR